jgi:hypothetical protein
MAPTQESEGTQGWNCEAVGQIVTLQLQRSSHTGVAVCQWVLSMTMATETWEPHTHRPNFSPSMLLKIIMKWNPSTHIWSLISYLGSAPHCLRDAGGAEHWRTAGRCENHSHMGCEHPVSHSHLQSGNNTYPPCFISVSGGWEEVIETTMFYVKRN